MCNKKTLYLQLAQVDKSKSSKTVFIASVSLQTGMYNVACYTFVVLSVHNDFIIYSINKLQVCITSHWKLPDKIKFS